MKLLYTLGIHLLSIVIALAALFNRKARLWRRGRRGIFRRMSEAIDPRAPLIWFHAASLGEFEQGRPVIEAFRKAYPHWKILLTFYSPSGYEVRKEYPGADYIFYLPADTPRNVRRFLAIARPHIAVFIKYEFWANYLFGLQRNGTKTFLISAIFQPGQIFFRPWGDLMRQALRSFELLFVQDEASRTLLSTIGIDRVQVAGDTRFDRVYAIAQAARKLPQIEPFSAGARVLVAGSTWPADEELILRLMSQSNDIKFILAPHEIDEARIGKLVGESPVAALRYTELGPENDPAATRLLIIDTIGILSSVYRYGELAYIGGGFGAGIHNTLEAATFGLPLAFGPRYERFREARELIASGGARSVNNYEELFEWFHTQQSDPVARKHSSEACRAYVLAHKGATEVILTELTKAAGQDHS